ncbi:helix-turn-helix domain-containing protein [Vibrio panuliri]|uniref:HTH lysR-type domain-containing protein n=1 Tax=Vibrio panuliri TaxID=1381081 RepID=A0ABX3FFV1_9VIBR|nr:LysR family transcriptional regulator [Vibrio panuliri]KAB1460863.1 LysR family transcriptional regulator [Vibrio panuliri]OLQ91668.1 hypothetical protein BIY20_09705 [Vibrio panuliri]
MNNIDLGKVSYEHIVALLELISCEYRMRSAADKLGIPQQQLARRIRRLEDALDMILIVRMNRDEFALTADGTKMLPPLKKLYIAYQAFSEETKNL